MIPRARVVAALARALVREPLTASFARATFREVLGRSPRFVRKAVARLLAHVGEGKRVRGDLLRRLLLRDVGLENACFEQDFPNLRLDVGRDAPPAMRPAFGLRGAQALPVLTTEGELATWLGVSLGHLDWLADRRTQEARIDDERLRHYRYRWIAKRGGAARLLEAPKPRLKAIQRRLLHELLVHVPAHDAAHGFRAGRDIVSFAAPHVGRALVLKLDLRDFFPSIRSSTILSIFLTAGYPEPVAGALAGLCVNTAPSPVVLGCPLPGTDAASVDRRFRLRALYRSPHLAQGAPTSPALANLALHRLDRRLAALAKASGAGYTRYADDLVFSGDEGFARRARRFYLAVVRVVRAEGYAPNDEKTRFLSRATRQTVAGLVVNERPNVPRRELDALKATLHNCRVHGPASQNRGAHPDFRAHLAGRIAHVEHVNAARGEKLRRVFDQIVWG